MVGLTPTQKEELKKDIYDYLIRNKFNNTAEMFATEAQVQVPSTGSSASKAG